MLDDKDIQIYRLHVRLNLTQYYLFALWSIFLRDKPEALRAFREALDLSEKNANGIAFPKLPPEVSDLFAGEGEDEWRKFFALFRSKLDEAEDEE
jgi:hypothetical protein